MTDELRADAAATEPVKDRQHALELLDDVDGLIRFCSVNMSDTGRYYRGSIAFWRVCHWIAALPKPEELGAVERNRRTLTDHGRMLWRDDVEGICPTPEICFDYGEHVRCGPCAIKQATQAGVESERMTESYLPEVCRLRRRLAELEEALRIERRSSTDKSYMLAAVVRMLGPKGREVWKLWQVQGLQRIHMDWGPSAADLSGEEIAQLHLDLDEALPSRAALDGEG